MTRTGLGSIASDGLALLVVTLGLLTASAASAQEGSRRLEEVRRFSAEEARQGVAVDDRYFYAISNRHIGKYDKQTGERVGGWEGAPDGPIIHLNSGIVLDGRLYCAHSNYPGVPMVSSIEVFETDTLEHVESHSSGIFGGSATWIDRADGHWWVAFGHYAGFGGIPDQGPAWTNLVKFDQSWRRVAGYVYPRDVVERFQEMSNSGGAWGEDGRLYVTGHDEAAVFALSLPTAGSVPPAPGGAPGGGRGSRYRLGSERARHAVLDSTEHPGGCRLETPVSRLN